MNVIFLGTNGWFESSTGNTICTLVKTENYDIVFDAGSGFYKIDRYIDGTKPVYLFLSHFHIDHISGLHGLSKINCAKGLFIVGQEGTAGVISNLVNRPYTVPISELKYKTEVLEIPAEIGSIPFGVEFLPLLHSDPCLGYRVKVDGRVITFCTDTGYCENAVKLGRDADLLITECAFLPGQENKEWPHLNPETAARIALESGAKKLVLTHFDAARYLDLNTRRDAEKTARGVFSDSVAAEDLMDIEIPPSAGRRGF